MLGKRQLRRLNESRRYGIGRLLLLARRDFLSRLARKMNGEDEVTTLARGQLLPYIDADGTRSTDLARRIGVTKQAVARMVNELELEGLLRREGDAADGRASLIKFTEAGLEYLVRMHKVIDQIERDYERRFGRETMRKVRKTLSAIAYPSGPRA